MSLLQKFQSASKHIKLTGDYVLVEEIQQAQELSKEIKREDGTVAGRLILNTESSGSRQLDTYAENKPLFLRILAVGEGFVGPDGDNIKADAKPGQIIWVSPLSVSWLSNWAGLLTDKNQRVGFMPVSVRLGSFDSDEAFEAYKLELSK